MPRINIDSNILFAKEIEKESQGELLHLITLGTVTDELGNTFPGMTLVDCNHMVKYQGITYQPFPLKFSGVSISTDGTIDKASITVSNVTRVLMGALDTYDGLAGCTVSVITVYEKYLDEKYTYSADGTLSVVLASTGGAPTSHTTNDPTAYIRDEYVIDSYTADEKSIVFQLNALINFEIRVPRRRFTPFSCYWRYKDASTCGYTGTNGVMTSTTTVRTSIPLDCVGRTLKVKLHTPSDTYTVTVTAAAVYNTTTNTLTISPAVPWSSSEVLLTFEDCKKSLDDCLLHKNALRIGSFPSIPSSQRRLYL